MRAALVIAMVWTTACGGDDGSGFGLGNVDIEDVPEAIQAAFCHHYVECGFFADEAACRATNFGFKLQLDPSLVAAIKAGKVKYDGRILGDCYEAFGDQSCDRTDLDGRVLAVDCQGALTGTVDAGGACAIDAECVSQMCDVPQCPDACCQGTCVGGVAPGPGRGIGEACEMTSECAVGGWCDPTTSLCAALEPAASSCSSDAECDYGLGCAGTTGMRTCKVLPVLGEACPDSACRDDGTFCEPTAKVCTRLGLPGDACSTTARCSFFYACDQATMVCVTGPRLGDACSNTSPCFDFQTYCKAGTCAALEAKGAACTDDSDCASDLCDPATNVCSEEPICF